MPSPDRRASRSRRRSYRPASVLDGLVTAILAESNHALTAYDIQRQSKLRRAPLTIAQTYRVLRRLLEKGVIQRIELLAAYLLVQDQPAAFTVCRKCLCTTALPSEPFRPALAGICRRAGFSGTRTMIEVSGLCADCRIGEATSHLATPEHHSPHDSPETS